MENDYYYWVPQNDDPGVRPEREKISCQRLLDMIESGDLSDVEGLCDDDDEQNEVHDFNAQVCPIFEEPVAGPNNDNKNYGNFNVGEECMRVEQVLTCSTLKEFQSEYFSSQNLTKKVHIRWKRASFQPAVLQPFVDECANDITSISTPTEFFDKYFDADILDKMVYFTNLYAVQNSVPHFQPTDLNEMKTFIGVHILMGVIGYPRIRMYWEEKFKIPLISDSINLNRFFKLRSNFHVVDTQLKSPQIRDRFWKVRPIFDKIKKRCSELHTEENLSIDEQMISFKGKLNVKQYIQNKPSKWGVKVFILCGASGTMYDFLIYQGITTELKPEYASFGLGAGVVMQLAERIKTPYCRLYFDNYFSTYQLFQWLKNKNMYSAGTIRVDQFRKPPLDPDSYIKKNETRGYSEEVVSRDDIVLTKWYDNSCVTLGSNFVGIGKEDTCKRWDKRSQKHIEVKRPEIVKLYNSSMGGVDKYDFLIALYRTFIRLRKWTLRMFTHSIDMAVTNSWLEYRKQAAALGIREKKILDLIHFRQYVSESFILSNASVTKKSPSLEKSPVVHPKRAATIKPIQDVRFDGVDHLPEHTDQKSQSRCKNPGCIGKTFFMCLKCKVHLCISRERNCFIKFHSK